MLPKAKVEKKAAKLKVKETLKPSVKEKEETFSTDDANVVASLTTKGFHVKSQTVIGDKLVYTFAEPKSEIEKAK